MLNLRFQLGFNGKILYSFDKFQVKARSTMRKVNKEKSMLFWLWDILFSIKQYIHISIRISCVRLNGGTFITYRDFDNVYWKSTSFPPPPIQLYIYFVSVIITYFLFLFNVIEQLNINFKSSKCFMAKIYYFIYSYALQNN